jgi:hypothetical protein
VVAPDLATVRWRTSSFSGNAGTCVEVAGLEGGHRAVRDSKNPAGPALTVPASEWAAFTTGIRADEFD